MRTFLAAGAVSTAVLLAALPAGAQQAPDVGRILQNVAPQAPQLAPLAPPAALPTPPPVPQPAGATVLVKGFHIVAKSFPEAELQSVVQSYAGRELTFAGVQAAARKIDEFYLAHDRVVRAVVPPQTIKDGIVEIDVVEGRLNAIAIDPSSHSRLASDIAIGFVEARSPVGGPVQPELIAGGLARLNEVPGVSATATMAPGPETGDTDAILKVTDTPLVTGNMTADNGGIRWSGRARLIDTAQMNDALGFGEQFTATFVNSELSHYGRFAAAMPVTYSGLTVGVNVSGLTYSLNGPFEELGEGGYAYTGGLAAVYPLYRSPMLSLTTGGTYDYKRLTTTIIGGELNNRVINVVGASLTGTAVDELFGNAVTVFSVGGAFGHAGLGDDSANLALDQVTARTAGDYAKVDFAVSRTQQISGPISGFFSVTGQLSSKNLDSSEQISLGGPAGVRAYPVNEAVGDQGAVLQAELRWQAMPEVQPFGFYDGGVIQQHHTTWAGWQPVVGQPNVYELQGAGIGVRWVPVAWLQVSGTAAHTLGENPGIGANGEQSDGYRHNFEVWLNGTATF